MKLIHSSSRLEGISDAVFAFAATLLVVSLEVPESFDLLKKQLAGFISFGISFFALIMIWKVHYNFFRRTDYVDNWIITFNMFLLFIVLYFVYPLKFLAQLPFGEHRLEISEFFTVFQLYSLGFCLIFVCISAMYGWAAKKTEAGLQKDILSFYMRHYGIFVAVSILSMVIANYEIGLQVVLPGTIYSLLGPLCYFHGIKYGYDVPRKVGIKN